MICVIAKLTPDATERLNILQKAVVSKKPPVKPFYGHITIATYLPDDEEFVQVCSEIIRETPSFRIRGLYSCIRTASACTNPNVPRIRIRQGGSLRRGRVLPEAGAAGGI